MARPPAVRQKGFTPLHRAIDLGWGVTEILQKDPGAAGVLSACGNLPLHLIGKATPVAAVTALLAAYPIAATVCAKDASLRLPLHAAIEAGATAEVVETLLRANPTAARATAREGALPLHYVNAKTSLDVTVALLRMHPAAAAAEDDTGHLPLHWAADTGAAATVVAAILAAHPPAASHLSKEGLLPLSFVCDVTPVETVAVLLRAYPEGVRVRDPFGNYPLHLAVDRGAPREAVAAILAAHPEAATAGGADGDLPLGCVGEETPPGVVQLLLAAAPEAASQENAVGQLPLHTAVSLCGNADTLTALLQANVGAAASRSHNGQLRTIDIFADDARPAAEELARRLCCRHVAPELRLAAAQLLIGPAADGHGIAAVNESLVRPCSRVCAHGLQQRHSA